MGNFECSCSREEYDKAKSYSVDAFNVASVKAKKGYNSAKDYTV